LCLTGEVTFAISQLKLSLETFNNRFGRKLVLIIGCLGSGVFGTLRAFAGSFWLFSTFEFFDAFFGAATYSTAFIIGQ